MPVLADDNDDDDIESGEYEEKEETEDEEEGRLVDERSIVIKDSPFSGFFSWIETVMVDGVEYPVIMSSLDFEEEIDEILLNYPRGNSIVHDPKVGVEGILKKPESAILEKITKINLPTISRYEILIVSGVLVIVITGLVVVSRRKLKTN
ncbi:MAG: hypothetical protein ACTSP3_12575 [Candidatus Heimdallarchaeaceae archaeon]